MLLAPFSLRQCIDDGPGFHKQIYAVFLKLSISYFQKSVKCTISSTKVNTCCFSWFKLFTHFNKKVHFRHVTRNLLNSHVLLSQTHVVFWDTYMWFSKTITCWFLRRLHIVFLHIYMLFSFSQTLTCCFLRHLHFVFSDTYMLFSQTFPCCFLRHLHFVFLDTYMLFPPSVPFARQMPWVITFALASHLTSNFYTRSNIILVGQYVQCDTI